MLEWRGLQWMHRENGVIPVFTGGQDGGEQGMFLSPAS